MQITIRMSGFECLPRPHSGWTTTKHEITIEVIEILINKVIYGQHR